LRARLEPIDRTLFARFRAKIRAGGLRGPALRRECDRFTTYRPDQPAPLHLGYDGLDVLLDGALRVEPLPATEELPPELVHFEPTPARVILDLVDHADLAPGEVIYDLGSGDGRVAILIYLLTGQAVRGIEIQPQLAAYADGVAAGLGATGVSFLRADARDLTYDDGTVFYLFTPFRDAALDAVLARLRDVARRRSIVVCSYGSCTRRIAASDWLRLEDPDRGHDFRLAIFRSVLGFRMDARRLPVEDRNVMGEINRLVEEEHQLLEEHERSPLDPTRQERLERIQVALDQCWDLLRQRRARREFGEDPNRATPRDPKTVEKYLQ
jgi:SAM-dependent methyltransferase